MDVTHICRTKTGLISVMLGGRRGSEEAIRFCQILKKMVDARLLIQGDYWALIRTFFPFLNVLYSKHTHTPFGNTYNDLQMIFIPHCLELEDDPAKCNFSSSPPLPSCLQHSKPLQVKLLKRSSERGNEFSYII